MNLFMKLAFLFSVGSVTGWCIELVFRRFFSAANPEHKWINPGFCTGPYLPIYGSGLCVLYLIARIENIDPFSSNAVNKIVLFATMAVCMTVIEYIAGMIALKGFKVRLWDYTDEWGNINGLICPKFSFFWAVLGAVYYFLVHPRVLNSLEWLAENLAFSFVIGMFYGIFIIDVVHSAQLITKLKAYAEENDVILRYETLKSEIRSWYDEASKKYHFFRPFRIERSLTEHIRASLEYIEVKRREKRS